VLRPIRSRWLELVRRGLLRVSDQRQLSMAPAGCTLDPSRLREQLDRYRRLLSTGLSVEDRDARLVITFGADVDVGLLREVLAIERACCSFFALDYDATTRQLSIGIHDPARADALTTLRSAVSGPQPRGGPLTSRSALEAR
jgi:hypothetical protein